MNDRNSLAFEIDLIGNLSEFSNNGLPTTPPSLSTFTTTAFRVLFIGVGQSIVRGIPISLTAAPLPAASILFGAGLIALVGLGAGSWRQRKNSLA